MNFLRGLFFCGAVTLCVVAVFAATPVTRVAEAQTRYLNAGDLVPKAELFFSPQRATFQEGSTFEVPIFINTKGTSVNTIDLYVRFDASRLEIVEPSTGKSIIALWMEAPVYDNTRGTARYIGGIPNGVNTASGLIASITFRSKRTGDATVSIADNSRVLMNDGVGSPVSYESNRGTYTIVPKPPEGVKVFSETHPFQDRWYNNNSPVVAWNKDAGVKGFSFVLDNKPNTVPDNTVQSTDTIKGFTDLSDGLWYFHIKAFKNNVWGSTSHYLIRIDSTPPASFTPELNYLSAAAITRLLVSYFTTDALSGIDHYEVGVIDRAGDPNQSPAFVQSESPYQLPFNTADKARVIVRAFDRAGNVRDASIDAEVAAPWFKFILDNQLAFLGGFIGLIVLLILGHYLFGHHVLRHLRRAFALAEKEEAYEKISHDDSVKDVSSVPVGNSAPEWRLTMDQHSSTAPSDNQENISQK